MIFQGVPDEAKFERFCHWNDRLGGVISDTPLPNMPVGAQLVPIKEAVQILEVGLDSYLIRHTIHRGRLLLRTLCPALVRSVR